MYSVPLETPTLMIMTSQITSILDEDRRMGVIMCRMLQQNRMVSEESCMWLSLKLLTEHSNGSKR